MKLNTQTSITIELTEDELILAIGDYLRKYKGVALPTGHTTWYVPYTDSFMYRDNPQPALVLKVEH